MRSLPQIAVALLIALPSLTISSIHAQDRAAIPLRAAVNTRSESELVNIEKTFPNTAESGLARLLRGFLRLQARDYSSAITILNDQSIAEHTNLGDYAIYYRAQAMLESGRREEGEREYRRLATEYPTSLLTRTALLQTAGSEMQRGDYNRAIVDLAPLVERNDGTALKMRADALEKLGKTNEAILTLRKLYLDAPQSAEADKVADRLAALGSSTAADAGQLKRRGDKLYKSGLYALAGEAYSRLINQFPNSINDETRLNAGVSFYKANQFQQAVDWLNGVRSPEPRADALYYYGQANLSLNNEPAALRAFNELRALPSGGGRAGEMLYAIGKYHEKRGRESQAATYYSQLIREFPNQKNAAEADFQIAWRAHRARDYATASKLLINHIANYGAVTDNRGQASFWAAVDTERAGNKAVALTLYRAMMMRYAAGWYGINAERRIEKLIAEGVQARSPQADPLLKRYVEGMQALNLPKESISNEDEERVVKAEQLTRIAMLQAATTELEYARDRAPGSPVVHLRVAQIYSAQGENVAAMKTLAKAYPDYGQTLPEEMSREIWAIFYPLKYWDTIKEEARRHNLDPYFVAGVIRQETVFTPDAKSRANAHGLMQFLPSTGKAVANKINLGGGLTLQDLYNPQISIQLGTAYLRQLHNQFNRFEYVFAAYNGGEGRVRRWTREMSTAEIEEWVENIPLSETRDYVKGVFRHARQYQRLYDDNGQFRSHIPK